MAENFQNRVSILNQKMSEFAPSIPHAVRFDVIKMLPTGWGMGEQPAEWMR